MTLKEYIEEVYPIDSLIERFVSDPIERIMKADELPCDDVMMIDGKLQKVIGLSSGEFMPVIELISYTKEDAKKISESFYNDYEAYMDNIVLEDFNVVELMKLSKEYMAKKEKERAML